MTKSPLILALEKKKNDKVNTMSESDRLLQMILAQVTKVADYFTADDKNENVTTQESHSP